MNIFQRVIIEPFESFFEKVLQFLPNFFTSILILIVGIVLAKILKGFFTKVFKAVGIDKFFERTGTAEMMKKGGIRETASVLFSSIVGWLTIIIFAIISMRALEIPAVERLLERFFLYLPNVFVAALIIFFGYLLGNFLGRATLIAAVNAGMEVSGLIGRLVKLTVFLLAITMALEQLGIGRGTIVIAFAIVFGGVVLALAIAFGLGGKDIAKEYLEKKMKGEEKDDIEHI